MRSFPLSWPSISVGDKRNERSHRSAASRGIGRSPGVRLREAVALRGRTAHEEFESHHYAFHVSDAEFDAILAAFIGDVPEGQLRSSHPSVTEMVTSNAAENAAMLAVNARIGFAVFRMHWTYQIERDVLGAWLSSRARAASHRER